MKPHSAGSSTACGATKPSASLAALPRAVYSARGINSSLERRRGFQHRLWPRATRRANVFALLRPGYPRPAPRATRRVLEARLSRCAAEIRERGLERVLVDEGLILVVRYAHGCTQEFGG